MGSERRKRERMVMVRVSDAEHEKLSAQAEACAYQSLAAYLREAGLHLKVESRVDQRAIVELLRLGSDLARLGNLLKLWLSNDQRAKVLGADFSIRDLAEEIEATRQALYQKAAEL